MYKIANWNLERPKRNTSKTKLAIAKIKEENPDLIVLTETSNAVDLSEAYPFSVKTKPYERTPNEHWVTIWSKWEINKEIKLFDNYRTCCGIISAPFGEIIIFGTIIPYHMAGVSGVRYGNLDYKAWEFHERDIVAQSEIWNKLKKLYPDKPLFIIGDFNQTRFGNKGYGTKKVRNLLTKILETLKIECVTEIDFSKHLSIDPKKGKRRNNIDHICVSSEFLKKSQDYKISGWDHFTEQGKYMSDHNAVFIEFSGQNQRHITTINRK